MPAEATFTARHPFAMYLLGLCVVSGAVALIGAAVGQPTEPPAIAATVPQWARLTWYGLLVAGGLLSLAGVWWPRRRIIDMITGLLWERRGVVGLAIGANLYGLTLLFLLHDFAGRVSGVLTVLFAGACMARLWDIRRDLNRIRTALKAGQ